MPAFKQTPPSPQAAIFNQLYAPKKTPAPVKQPTVVQTVPRATTPAPANRTVGGYSPSFQGAYNQLRNQSAPARQVSAAPAPVVSKPTPAPTPVEDSDENDPNYWYNILKSYGMKKGGAVNVKATSRMRTTQQGKKNSKW